MKDKKDDQRQNANSLKRLTIGLGIFSAILLASNIWTLAVYAPSQQSGTISDAKSKYPLLDPSRGTYDRADRIINFQSLRDFLNNEYEADKNVSIYFEFLNTGANIAMNKDAEFWPASLLKVPVAMAATKKIEAGDWKWDSKLVLTGLDKDEKFGDLYKQPVGSTFTIEDLLRRSLSDSDNTAHFMLIRNLEPEEIEAVYKHIGLDGYLLNTSSVIGAKQYSALFRSLYTASYISGDNSQKLLMLMAQSSFREYLSTGLPTDISFAHKFGIDREKKVWLDSGIVYRENRPYILTVMIKSEKEDMARVAMKTISENVYRYINEYKEE